MTPSKSTSDPEAQALARCYDILLQAAARRRKRLAEVENENEQAEKEEQRE